MNKHKDQYEQQKRQLEVSVETMMKLDNTRYFLKYLLSILPLYSQNFTGDPIKDAYANGRRSVALDLVEILGENNLHILYRN